MRAFISRYRKLILVLLILILLTPISYYLSERFEFGEAWGEWGTDVVKEKTGIEPKGMKKLEGTWQSAPMPDYSLPGIFSEPLGYIISAVAGGLVLIMIFFIYGRVAGKDVKR